MVKTSGISDVRLESGMKNVTELVANELAKHSNVESRYTMCR